jgi:ubiquinone biosynthesis monooxygenase Coq7
MLSEYNEELSGEKGLRLRFCTRLPAGCRFPPSRYPANMTFKTSARSADPVDRILGVLDRALRTLSGGDHATRPSPGQSAATSPPQFGEADSVGALDADATKMSGALMRVNHVGEVCAQALYSAQALTTRSPRLRTEFEAAARDETDHLVWTRQRLGELGARPSLLNPLWYAGAFGLGLLAGRAGDALSLGFVVETERQVEQHLASHLERLPVADRSSRAIVAQMRADEARHGAVAEEAGAAALPAPVRWAMRAAGRVMTTTAHYV